MNVSMRKHTHRAQSEELSDTYGLTPVRYKHQQCFQAGERNDNCNMKISFADGFRLKPASNYKHI